MKVIKLSYRRMEIDDIDTVMQVETKVYTYPWTERIFKDCIRVGYDCWLALDDDYIVAHAVISVAAGESHILNISVAENYQGHGIGKQFIEFLVDIARNKKASMILLEVRQSNMAAISCYHATGFNEIGCRKDYYPAENGREDALLFAREIG
ncbi:MAG: ribosomal protein S18-alanine N-acetyltransferase [Gammaproteobacteria bacterium]|nr:ribosomal protein S18-alanine N-acetyltransferase [Gammaproteobacteria bacterium]